MTVATQLASLENGVTLFIGGSWRRGAKPYERYDPASLDRISGRFSSASPEDVEAAYTAAQSAQPDWAATPAPARAEILRRAADGLDAEQDAATRRLTADMGKAAGDARAEVVRSIAIFRYFAGELLQPAGEVYPSVDPDTVLFTVEEPLGVICGITPWNFPFAIPAWKIAPAIGFGNAVVWKPAEAASGSAVFLTETLQAAGLPDGILNLVTGQGRAISTSLTRDPRLRALTFTGSSAVGVALRQAVADRNVKVQLELGGKNPAIVLADADLADAAAKVVRGAMLSTGQRCTATSRVYVESAVAKRFAGLVRREVEQLVVGDPFEVTTDLGPLASVEQRDRVGAYLDLARQEGAESVVGGEQHQGCFVSPTVLTKVNPKSALMREEIFGPVLVIEEVADFDGAVAAANDTEFGLSSSLFTRSLARAMEFVRRTQSGVVQINRETSGVEPHVPFGGLKGSSSMSREQGKAARQFFTTTKTVYLRTT
jgi:acyl-CoA reductase-like NAD-dependent aldehyde dehydrogenase